MANVVDIKVPDIGDFKNVDVIEVLVRPGDSVQREDSLITLESEKATMEVPSPAQGVVRELQVKPGDKVSQGSAILKLQVQEAADSAQEAAGPAEKTQAKRGPTPNEARAAQPQRPEPTSSWDVHAEVMVLGAGPAGYTAAFRAADLGKQVVLIERYASLGGVCLNVGCIPSKALLHVAAVIDEAAEMKRRGVDFPPPQIDLDKLRAWKNSVVNRLTSGLAGLARRRQVRVIQGVGEFSSPHEILVRTAEGVIRVSFDYAIIAAGSRAVKLPSLPDDDPRILDATSALELPQARGEMLVIGCGIIGLEMATVYHALGASITLTELADTLMPGVDADLLKPLQKRIQKRYENIYLKTRVTAVQADKDGLVAHFEGEGAPASKRFDRILVAVGRRSNADRIGIEATGVRRDSAGFIIVDQQRCTNVPHIFAVGDIAGHPLLAHKGSHEGRVAAEVIGGLRTAFDARAIPAVAYTDPEVAWSGLTEQQAKAQNIAYGKAVFPWAASGRALSVGREEGVTKILFDEQTRRVLGIGIVGANAGELITEGTLAIEMGADAEDLAKTIHPHPTLSETLGMAAEVFEGTVTDIYVPKR